MNTNNAATCDSTVRRNLHRESIDLVPLRLPSFLGLIMGVLMLMAVGAPSAHALPQPLTYFDFENGDFTGTNGATIFNDAVTSFPGGAFPSGQVVITDGVGAPTGTSGHALDLRGNANLNAGSEYCFDLGAITTNGQFIIALSFDIASVGNGGQFDQLMVYWSTSTTFVHDTAHTVALSPFTIGTKTMTIAYQTVTGTFTIPSGTTSIYLQFCFVTTSGNNGNPNHTYLDNIGVTGDVPEPTTAISGALAAVGLFWRQRKRLSAIFCALLA